MRYHLPPVRVAIINKSTHNNCWRGCGEKGTLLYCCWECKFVQPLWKTVWRYLRKLYVELPHDPAIPLLGIYPGKTFLKKATCTRMFIAALFTIARTWKQPKWPSTDDWIQKRWYIYIFLIHSSVDGHLGCFHALAIVYSAAVNIWVHVSFSRKVLSGYMPKSGIARSYGSSLFHIIDYSPSIQVVKEGVTKQEMFLVYN